MPRGKKNPTTAATKTASKTAESIKEVAAEPEKKTVTAEKKRLNPQSSGKSSGIMI